MDVTAVPSCECNKHEGMGDGESECSQMYR